MRELSAAHQAVLFGLGFLVIAVATAAYAQKAPTERHQLVNALRPVGYWPADEGEGEILHDRSGNGNHGRAFHTPWVNGLLDFTSGFQWAEIPGHEKYQGRAFTIGGWLFSRRASYRRNGMLFMGMANPIRLWISPAIILRIREASEIEVVSHGTEDAIGSKAEKDTISANQWQHVLYAYEAGVGKLYLNGQLARSKDNVPFEIGKYPLLIGSCADWWMLHPPGSNSLDGSVRELTLFDRALSPAEVTRLCDATRPERQPRVLAADAIVIDGRETPLGTLSAASAEDRSLALEQLEKRKPEAIRPMSDALLPVLVRSLQEWQTRRVAASLLFKLDREEARAALGEALPRLTQTLQNEGASREERAACALALAEMKGMAKDALPALAAVLGRLLEKEGARLPRVEDIVRNALIRALLDGDPENKQARHVLGLALAKPILDTIDLSRPYLEKVRPLVEEGRYMDALDAYRALPPNKHG
ncbi:MAG: hypothetical protein FJ279_23950, partial [Planctomycetes bacterium]|nr:hypothetical protein [Planctomycetota bacterium]